MGLGRGWLAARERGRDAESAVIALVLDDPRLDRQIESRDVYYATLLLALGADVGPLAARANEPVPHETDAWLLLGTLGEMARRGQRDARRALELAANGPNRERARFELEPELPQAPPRDVLHHTPPRGTDLEPIRAVLEAEAVRTERRDREQTIAYRRALRALDEVPPSAALPWARAHLDAPWPVSLGARRVLERRATEDDRADIERRAALALANDDHYPLCSYVDALGAIASAESIPVLRAIYDTAPYSYVRGRVVRALAAHGADPRVAERMRESLWDADLGARVEAAREATLSDPAVRARIEELARDDAESADVRNAARDRLA